MKSLKSVVVGALAAVVVFGGIQVVSGVTDNKQIKACANKSSGVMRYTTKSCKKNETTLVFNSKGVPGVAGAKGDTGVPGSAGAKGDTGVAGAAGAKGDTGVAGAAGSTGVAGASGASGANVNSQVKNICGVNGITACAVGVQGPGGGIVFMTPSTAGNTSGLFYEAAPSTWSHPSSGDPVSAWCSNGSTALGVVSTTVSTGAMDGADKSAVMLAECATGAANLVDLYSPTVSGVVYGDWFLPSKGELNQMYVNKTVIGGFTDVVLYSSSSEGSGSEAWQQYFLTGAQSLTAKSNLKYVRPVRAF